MTTTTLQTTQVYQVFIKASPEAIWDAITKPEFSVRYFHGARIGSQPNATRRPARMERSGATRPQWNSIPPDGSCTAGALSTIQSWRLRRRAA
jgi:uncharacterized protein YndB with AHSA1/START domain